MGYMTFGQQVAQHLQFLQNAGLQVTNLMIDSPEFIRSRDFDELGRGERAYKTVSRLLNNGMTGLMTWCRYKNGQVNTYKTYGYAADLNGKKASNGIHNKSQPMTEEVCHEIDLEKIRKFWELSSQQGASDYLLRKGVKAYRIRFRDNQYGKVAVIPLRDIQGRLCSYQILNANGSKVFAKRVRLAGLFHQLTELTDGLPIGVAEGYVTAATCLELVGMPMVTAFTSDNLGLVVDVLQQHYPNSPLVMYADNDRHLVENKGIKWALDALKRCKKGGIVLSPYFDSYPATYDYSDWNDLVREIGSTRALEQIQAGLHNAQNDELKGWIADKCNKTLELKNKNN